MKKLNFSSFFVLLFIVALTACKEQNDVSMEQILRLQDSVGKMLPGTTAIDVKVVHQNELKIIVCNIPFYNLPYDQKHEAAMKATLLAFQIFGTDNGIKIGKLIVTKENRNTAWDNDPKDGVITDMKYDSLRTIEIATGVGATRLIKK